MKIEEYEKLISDIESILNKSNEILSKDLFKIDEIIDKFRSEQQNIIDENIRFRELVYKLSGCDVPGLNIKTKKRSIVEARWFIMAYSKIYLNKTLAFSASEFGLNHYSCLWAINKIKELQFDKQFSNQYREIYDKYDKLIKYESKEYNYS